MLAAVPSEKDFKVGVDASYVVGGVPRLEDLQAGENGDLWSVMEAVICDREHHGGNTEVYKVKAHLDEEGVGPLVQGRITATDLIGNCLADRAA